MENVADFLRELTELTMKYEIKIGGCGCCGSPFLMETGAEDHQNGAAYSVDDDNDDLALRQP